MLVGGACNLIFVLPRSCAAGGSRLRFVQLDEVIERLLGPSSLSWVCLFGGGDPPKWLQNGGFPFGFPLKKHRRTGY